MNTISIWFGSLPSCMGANGLSSKIKFQAKSGVSMVFFGVCQLLSSIFVGGTLTIICKNFPISILNIMLVVGGLELAYHGCKKLDYKYIQEWCIGVAVLLSFNTWIGFVVTWILFVWNQITLPTNESSINSQNEEQELI